MRYTSGTRPTGHADWSQNEIIARDSSCDADHPNPTARTNDDKPWLRRQSFGSMPSGGCSRRATPWSGGANGVPRSFFLVDQRLTGCFQLFCLPLKFVGIPPQSILVGRLRKAGR
jgi:hypothetical protein